jgi:hypothetical protein
MQGSSAISALPPYLNVQMVRFFFKLDTRQKAKILRKVRAPGTACSVASSAVAPLRCLVPHK